MSYRSGHHSEYHHTTMITAGRRPGAAAPTCRRSRPRPGRLRHRPCRQAGPVRPRGVLDRGRHHRRARHVVGGDRHLFRVSRRRPDPADRPPGRDAIRLRRPHRRTARQGRPHHQPPVARSGTVRPETRPDHAPPDRAGIARHRARRDPGRRGHRIDPAAGARRRRGYARLRHPKTLADQRHRDLRGAAGS